MQPKVSVIIPCYNQAAFLPKAVASLQAQTMPEWECIIVDDGSPDNAAEIANNIALKEPRVRLIQQTNQGLASARNAGLKQAKGEYIQFLDADDTIAPEKLDRQAALMDQQGLDISYTAFCYVINGKHTPTRSVLLNLQKILVSWGLGTSMPIHAFLYRKSFVDRYNLQFIHSRREDCQWHINCFSKHPKQALIADYCGAYYYQNEAGMTGNYVRIQEGNFEFMAFMLPQMKGLRKLLWLFRISEEVWIWLLRMIKYRSTKIAKSILLLPIPATIIAILLMPLSVWWVLVYFIKTYIAK